MISYKDFVQRLMKPGAEIQAEITAAQLDFLHMAVGFSGEIAEVFGDPNPNLAEELGDCFFYLTGACISRGMEPPSVPVPGFLEMEEPALQRSLIGLSGDLLDIAKRWGIYQKEFEEAKFQQVIADAYVALLLLCRYWGLDLMAILSHNVDKLSRRYPNGYSNKSAQERLDKAE